MYFHISATDSVNTAKSCNLGTKVCAVSEHLNNRDTLQPLATPLSRLGSFWLRLSIKIQVLLLVVLLLVKNGLDIELRNIQEAYLPGSLLFPDPAGYYSASFGQVLFANAFQLTNTTMWIAAHIALTLIVIGMALWLINRNFSADRSFMLLILAATTSMATVMISIGKYDIFTFAGGLLLILARSNWAVVLGALLLASGNPEQAILASLSLLVLSRSDVFGKYRTRSVIALSVSILAWISVQIWFWSAGLSTGRLALVSEYLGESLSNLLTAPLQEIWSWLGVGWVIVLAALILMKGKERIILAVALIAIPAAATVITADGARVFGAIVLPSFLALGIWLVTTKIQVSRYSKQAVGLFLILLILLPSTLEKPGWYDGQIRGRLMSFTEQIFN